MKNLSIVFNLILLALIGVLFWLYFSLKKGPASDTSMPATAVSNMAGKQRLLHIAHVNVDTLNAKYQLMLDFKREIESRQNSIQAEYDSKAKVLQNEYVSYQQKAQAQTISQVDAEKMQKDLQAKKDELDNLQRRHDDLLKEAQDRNVTILTLVQKYVAGYNKKMHFDYILAFASSGSNILFANDSLDVTKDIVSGLNVQYKDSLQKMSAKPH